MTVKDLKGILEQCDDDLHVVMLDTSTDDPTESIYDLKENMFSIEPMQSRTQGEMNVLTIQFKAKSNHNSV